MITTLNKIRSYSPCESGWKRLLSHLGKTKADDCPVSILTILESNGLDDALWCLRAVDGQDTKIRKLACTYALQVADLWEMPPVVKRFLETPNEGIRAAAGAVAGDAAWSAAGAVARDATRKMQEESLRELCGEHS